jgi:hypothetical protein
VELWQATIGFLRTAGVTSEPWGRDRGRVEELLAELYLLGERPSVEEVRVYLDSLGIAAGHWGREIVRLWRKRVRRPGVRLKGRGGWVYPFAIPDGLVEEHGLRSVDERLLDALAAASTDYLRLAEAEPGSPRVDEARALLHLTAQAVDWRGLSRDRAHDHGWPSVTLWRRGPDTFAEYHTRAGEARRREREERLRREYEAAFPPRVDWDDEEDGDGSPA